MIAVGGEPIDVPGLEGAVREADPDALLVPARILRRVIKRDRGLTFVGGSVTRRKTYAIAREPLRAIVDGDELGLRPGSEWPEVALLLLKPDPQDLAARPREAVLVDYWRLLFHARVELAAWRRFDEGGLSDAALRDRIERIGLTEFEEIRLVLRQEGYLLPRGTVGRSTPGSPRSISSCCTSPPRSCPITSRRSRTTRRSGRSWPSTSTAWSCWRRPASPAPPSPSASRRTRRGPTSRSKWPRPAPAAGGQGGAEAVPLADRARRARRGAGQRGPGRDRPGAGRADRRAGARRAGERRRPQRARPAGRPAPGARSGSTTSRPTPGGRRCRRSSTAPSTGSGRPRGGSSTTSRPSASTTSARSSRSTSWSGPRRGAVGRSSGRCPTSAKS